jgi:hypothetical protein
MRGDWGVGFTEVAINVRVAGERARLRAVSEVVDVFGSDDVDELELSATGSSLGLSLSSSLRRLSRITRP